MSLANRPSLTPLTRVLSEADLDRCTCGMANLPPPRRTAVNVTSTLRRLASNLPLFLAAGNSLFEYQALATFPWCRQIHVALVRTGIHYVHDWSSNEGNTIRVSRSTAHSRKQRGTLMSTESLRPHFRCKVSHDPALLSTSCRDAIDGHAPRAGPYGTRIRRDHPDCVAERMRRCTSPLAG